jgi:hypothetical protein
MLAYLSEQIKTQKRAAAHRAATLFWVLCPNKADDSYSNLITLL